MTSIRVHSGGLERARWELLAKLAQPRQWRAMTKGVSSLSKTTARMLMAAGRKDWDPAAFANLELTSIEVVLGTADGPGSKTTKTSK